MFKKYVKLGLLIFVISGTVLVWVVTENNKDQKRAAFYKTKYGSEPEEYLKQYNEWLQLPPAQRANLPWWLDKYGKTKTENQLQKEQQERLNADLEKLATGKKDANPFADILYGEKWRIKLNEYKKQRRMRGYIFTGSIVCALMGGAIVACCLVLWIYQILIKASSNLRKSVTVVSKGQSPNKDQKMNQVGTKEKIIPKAKERAKVQAERKSKPTAEKMAQAKTEPRVRAKLGRKAKAEEEKVTNTKVKARAKIQTQEKVRATVEAKAKVKEERIDKDESESREKVGVSAEDGKAMDQHQERRGLRRRDKKQTKALGNSDWNTCNQDSANHTAVLVKDEESNDLVESLEKAAENANENNKNEDSLKEKTENLEKQMEEFRQMAQGVRQTTLENSQPINNTLSELTQQVSAIREYASSQQDRLTKLQDGYDWNITKTFCMRVIRCIDNLEKRISQLSEKDMEVIDLEEVRDEMLFALESSGVEQYVPELNSDYHGQEKFAEAVKGKESCDGKKKTGKIAKIIRPGYQFFIDEENVKIVRPAQVKLYG
jgi:chemotaxis protein histidine kinase CheA